MSEVLSRQVSQSIEIGWLKSFERVIIKDSSKFDLNRQTEG